MIDPSSSEEEEDEEAVQHHQPTHQRGHAPPGAHGHLDVPNPAPK